MFKNVKQEKYFQLMMKNYSFYILIIIYWAYHYTTIAQITPPIIYVHPRQWEVPIDEKIGAKIAWISLSDNNYGIPIKLSLSKPKYSFAKYLKDASPYFTITFSSKINKGIIQLSQSLSSTLRPGDRLSLEIVGESNTTTITSRIEVFITITHSIRTKFSENIPVNLEDNPNYTTEKFIPKTVFEDESGTKYTTIYIIIPLVIVFIICISILLIYRSYFYKYIPTRRSTNQCGIKLGEDEIISGVNTIEKNKASNDKSIHKKTSLDSTLTDYTMLLDNKIKWEISRHSIKILHMLGEGCFGQVWKGEMIVEGRTSTIAVKTVKESANEVERKDLLKELCIMKMLGHHPNIITLIGCCTEKDPMFVVLEYVSGGTLQEYLRKSRSDHNYNNLHAESSCIKSKDLTSYAYQVAKAMEYLSYRKIIHRDLAARNVLIDNTLQICKVVDFGFARDIMNHSIYERKSDGRLPIRWMAPESLFYNIYSTKSDVWSFGVLIWEIVTLGSTPYPGKSASDVMKFLREGYRLEKPEHCGRELYNLMYYCWVKKPDDRPCFKTLVKDFEKLLLQETDYIDLHLFPEHEYYNELNLSGEKV